MRLGKILLVLLVLYSCGNDQSSSLVRGVNEVNTPRPPAGHDQFPIPKIETLQWYPNNIWQQSWSNTVVDKVTQVGLNQQKVEIDDLADLECLGYANASSREKTMFWLVIIASVASQESAFDPNNRYYERTLGQWSEGLMQLSVSDRARGGTCTQLDSNTIVNPNTNLECGILILKDQLQGSSTRVANQVFPLRAYYWSTLTRESSKSKVIAFFKKHLNQLKFCSKP